MPSKIVSLPFIPQLLQATAITLVSGALVTFPVRSADEIYLDYGPLGRVLPVSSLEAFAEDGTIDSELAPYFNRLPADNRQAFQQALSTPLTDLSPQVPELLGDPFALSQWLYSPIGESVLARLGHLIKTEGRGNGEQAIRAAMILAAADPEGLSIINLIRYYPTGGLRLDLRQILTLYRAINTNLEATERLSNIAAQGSAAAAATEPRLEYAALPVLSDSGQFGVAQYSFVLQDDRRDRTFPVDLYVPQNLSAITGPIPVMVLSHGYGDSRTNPEAVAAAQSLAANGFFVAMPEYIGSNKAYHNDLERGLNHESFEVMEFINRPMDISFLLDTLEQLNNTEFQGRLQLDRVGLLGHSFGGYTVLATAGATVDLTVLEQRCDLDAGIVADNVNIALLLQCRVLELAESPEVIQQLTSGGLIDDRVGLVMALAPVSSLFGEGGMDQLQMPVVILGGTNDIATPVALEQLSAFRGLTTPEKYLYLGENLSHSPALTQLILSITNPSSDIVDNFDETGELFSSLVISLAIAHGQVHLRNDESYRPYLTSSYVEAVSVEPLNLHLLRSVPDDLD